MSIIKRVPLEILFLNCVSRFFYSDEFKVRLDICTGTKFRLYATGAGCGTNAHNASTKRCLNFISHF